VDTEEAEAHTFRKIGFLLRVLSDLRDLRGGERNSETLFD
jgi:hypothetical protein